MTPLRFFLTDLKRTEDVSYGNGGYLDPKSQRPYVRVFNTSKVRRSKKEMEWARKRLIPPY